MEAIAPPVMHIPVTFTAEKSVFSTAASLQPHWAAMLEEMELVTVETVVQSGEVEVQEDKIRISVKLSKVFIMQPFV